MAERDRLEKEAYFIMFMEGRLAKKEGFELDDLKQMCGFSRRTLLKRLRGYPNFEPVKNKRGKITGFDHIETEAPQVDNLFVDYTERMKPWRGMVRDPKFPDKAEGQPGGQGTHPADADI